MNVTREFPVDVAYLKEFLEDQHVETNLLCQYDFVPNGDLLFLLRPKLTLSCLRKGRKKSMESMGRQKKLALRIHSKKGICLFCFLFSGGFGVQIHTFAPSPKQKNPSPLVLQLSAHFS